MERKEKLEEALRDLEEARARLYKVWRTGDPLLVEDWHERVKDVHDSVRDLHGALKSTIKRGFPDGGEAEG